VWRGSDGLPPTVTVDGQTVPIRARELEGDERAEAFDRFVATYEGYAQYVEWTDRQIPVVLLQR
jgi:F420H(2)-dependent quinone reductase